jgi:hypothetical protein
VETVGPIVEQEYAKLRGELRPERLEALYDNLRHLIKIGRP